MSEPAVALSELGAAAESNPRDPLAWYRWAVGLAMTGQRPAALSAVRQALPQVERAQLAVGMGKLFEILEQPVEALAAYRRATQLDPRHVEGQVCMASLLTRVGDPRAASLALKAALARTPDVPSMEAELAEALLASGRYEEALEHARRATELGIAPEIAHRLMARVHEAQGQPDASLSELKQISGFALEDAKTMVNLARQLIASGDNAQALAALERAAKAGPQNPPLRLSIGVAMAAAGAKSQALAVLKQTAQMAPDNGAVHLALGRTLRAAGQTDEAVSTLRTAVRLSPNDAQGLAELGTLLGQVGELEDAAHLLVRAASLAPEDDDIRESLARALAHAPKRRPGSNLPGGSLAPGPSESSPTSLRQTSAGFGGRSGSAVGGRKAGAGGITSDLSMFSLPELLEFLLQQRATGTLSLRSAEGQEAALDLYEGQLTGARWPGGKRLADVLVHDQGVTTGDLNKAITGDIQYKTDPGLTSAVLKSKLVERDKLFELVAAQVKGALMVLVPWREGQAVFHRAAKDKPVVVPEIVVETRWALMETVRLLDENNREHDPPTPSNGTPSFDPFEGL